MHYFHCVGDASVSKGNLIGGDGKGNFFCRNLFSRLKALYHNFISLACDVFLCFVSLCTIFISSAQAV